MSRIGKKPVSIPSNVKVSVAKNKIFVEGPKGKLEQEILQPIAVEVKDGELVATRPSDSIANKTKHGTVRALANNMIIGVTSGFKKSLIIEGVGFKANLQGKKLVLNLGYSHPINLDVPEGITVTVGKPTEVDVEGIDKQQVGFFAAKIRSFYEPEPYKGKGIRYSTEQIRRKAGKSVSK